MREIMSNSKQEEVIAVLWIIAAVMAFGFGFTVFGWIFAIKGFSDTAISVFFAIKEAKENLSIKKPAL